MKLPINTLGKTAVNTISHKSFHLIGAILLLELFIEIWPAIYSLMRTIDFGMFLAITVSAIFVAIAIGLPWLFSTTK